MKAGDDTRTVADGPDTGGSVRSFLLRFAIFCLAWIILTGGDWRSWGVALLVMVVSAIASMAAIPPGAIRLSPIGVLRFLPFFLRYSARGGVDVAARALRGTPGLDPGTIEFWTTLPPGPPRTFFVAILGLLPGTLTARQDVDRLEVHVLDRRVDLQPQLTALQGRVAALFGVDLEQSARRPSALDAPEHRR